MQIKDTLNSYGMVQCLSFNFYKMFPVQFYARKSKIFDVFTGWSKKYDVHQ